MYNRPRIIPCLLLKERGLVKTVKFMTPDYLGDPINAIRIFNEKEVDELCVLDIEASRKKGDPDFSFLEKIAAEAFMPVSYGGGISCMEHIKRIFHIGYEKVVINTAFACNPKLVKQAAEYAGSQSVVVSIDAKRNFIRGYSAYMKGGTVRVRKQLCQLAQQAEHLGAGEIFVNSIDRDGKMCGYDLELIREITGCVDIPVTACGGARGTEDLKKALSEGGAHAVAAGSMFVYYGRKKAILIHTPTEKELYEKGIFFDE